MEKKGFKWVNERPDAESENDEKWGWIGSKPGGGAGAEGGPARLAALRAAPSAACCPASFSTLHAFCSAP